ncbi:MAG: TetR/AcrR family transcriptional regulator [Acidimicrobiaceae bacterium]|nr:TetR/AcrR family transcriptional regulator [Ilumatobacter sp.]MCB9381382.1 TetR/AcrR family transcriptional regulator [Acidimicrobiaceae bacterium]MCO5330302.1 TetR/AcrR family transcriptional regulator [Ilumatobacteraceae bacterium]
MSTRTTRSNGEASRRRILDAAAEIAGERGYAGTSISDVSARSGLPKSSIYWHFTDKDALFAAVIEDSYQQWRAEFDDRLGDRRPPAELVTVLHDSLASMPAFLRFGQLVTLEHRDTELSARAAFLEIRRRSLATLAEGFAAATGVTADQAGTLAALALALVDGAALARAAGEHALDDGRSLGDAFAAIIAKAVPG